MKIGNIYIKFFNSLGLAIFKDVYVKPYNEFFSHAWNIIFFVVRIQITYLSEQAYEEANELKNLNKNGKN